MATSVVKVGGEALVVGDGMRVDLFDFSLPADLIAQRPVRPRDASRLLHVGTDGPVDRVVLDLPNLLHPGDIMVFNDTRVIPARLFGRRGDVAIEVTLHRHDGGGRWRAFARPARRLRAGQRLDFAADLAAEVIARTAEGEVVLEFALEPGALLAALERHGHMPLPPYIKRPQRLADDADHDDYQTLLATRPGAVAAPTAGLHFTPQLLSALDGAGILRTTVTLHVGAGTFLPVKSETTAGHVMHGEWGEIGAPAAAAIAAARAAGGRVVAVGTTTLRLLEAAADAAGHVPPWAGTTDLFITPGFRFRVVERLLTNFHLPRSTLFMLVAAFSGRERMLDAYRHAIAARYRFYSYGDACLLERSLAP